MTKTPPSHALFFDVETTGLDPESLSVLEVGAVLVEWDADCMLPVVGEFHEVVRPLAWEASVGSSLLSDVDLLRSDCPPFVQEMHDRTGLWDDVMESNLTLPDADEKLTFWLDTLAGGDEPVALGGSGVSHFDRPAVIDRQMPKLASRLHYWDLDAGVVRRFFERSGAFVAVPEQWDDGSALTAHRALDDARSSVLQARAYLSAMRR